MDVDLGLELAKCFDEYVSTSPIFISDESENMFILTAILKGYTRELIKIDVNDYGRSIVISGEKPVQDMVMVGWKVYKKEIKMVGFTKAFMIPDGVIIDQIKATFNQESFKLSVTMPKMANGIKGIRVKEVKEEELGIGDYRSLQVDDDDDHIRKIYPTSGDQLALVPEQGGDHVHMKDEAENEIKQENVTTIQTFDDAQDYVISHDVLPRLENQMMDIGLEETREKCSTHEEHEAITCDQHKEETLVYKGDGTDTTQEKGCNINEPTTKAEKTFRDQATQTDRPRRPKKCCAPLIGGSALLVSILVFVIHFIRDQDKPKKKK